MIRTFTILPGGNTSRPVHHHKPRRTGRLWAISTTLDGNRIVYFRDNRSMPLGVA